MTTVKRTARKLSWVYDDLAQQIQVDNRHLAAKLVLRHLGSKANDTGESHHGYLSIAAHCSIARSQVSLALKYLRDNLKILTWVKGTGGPKSGDTNRFRLSLSAMRQLVREQKIFDINGKLIRVESAQQPSIQSAQQPSKKAQSSLLKGGNKGQSSLLKAPVESAQQPLTLNEPSDKSNPQLTRDDKGRLQIVRTGDVR
jgi:hypothetical protein